MPRPLVAASVFGALAVAAWTGPVHAASKTLVYGLYSPPDTLDSAKMATNVALHPAWLICDTLVTLSKDGERVEPGLATSWDLEGLQATLKLRRGVRFHDGTAVDADAVQASIERHLRPAGASDAPNTREQLLRKLIDHVRVVDASTIVLKLNEPRLDYLSQIDVISPTAEARLGKDFGNHPVCSGPFKFESWSDDRREIVVVANERYWTGRPKIDRVVFRVFEPGALADAAARGDVHFIPDVVQPEVLEKLRRRGMKLVHVPALNVTFLGFNLQRPPFNDLRVRRAIAEALDVKKMATFLGSGAAIPATGPLPPMFKAYDPSARQPAFNRAHARKLLSEAGHRAGFDVGLIYHHVLHQAAALAIKGQLQDVDVRVELIPRREWSEVPAAIREPGVGLFLFGWNVRSPHPDRILVPLFHSRSPESSNINRYRNERVDELLDKAAPLPEGHAQNTRYADVQQRIVRDGPAVFLYHTTRVAAVDARVRGLEMNRGTLPYDKLVHVDLVP